MMMTVVRLPSSNKMKKLSVNIQPIDIPIFFFSRLFSLNESRKTQAEKKDNSLKNIREKLLFQIHNQTLFWNSNFKRKIKIFELWKSEKIDSINWKFNIALNKISSRFHEGNKIKRIIYSFKQVFKLQSFNPQQFYYN